MAEKLKMNDEKENPTLNTCDEKNEKNINSNNDNDDNDDSGDEDNDDIIIIKNKCIGRQQQSMKKRGSIIEKIAKSFKDFSDFYENSCYVGLALRLLGVIFLFGLMASPEVSFFMKFLLIFAIILLIIIQIVTDSEYKTILKGDCGGEKKINKQKVLNFKKRNILPSSRR